MEKPTDIEVEKAIIKDCLAYYWRCKCCIHLRFSLFPNWKCKHYEECGDYVYKKLKEHFKIVLDRESKGL